MGKDKGSSINKRINNAVEIINHAIANSISVKEASVRCGYSNTYVKNIKALVTDKLSSGDINIDTYNSFYDEFNQYIELRSNSQHNVSQHKEQTIKHKESNKPRDIPSTGNRETFKSSGNNAEYEWVGGKNYPSDHIRTVDQLLAATDVDTDVWKVKDFIVNKWDVTSWKKLNKNGEPKAETIQNFQVKARLERDVGFVRERVVGELFQEMAKDYIFKPSFTYNKPVSEFDDEQNLLEISIFDLHIGKLSWGGETYENYDVKIARKRFLSSIEKLLKRAEGFNYNRILFPVGNDFFNSDNMQNTTTKGTQQDEDLRWQKTFGVGVRLLVDAINLLKQSGVHIDVVVIPGNHDFERSFYMGEYLGAWFNQDSTVSVNNGASPRKYYRYGNVLLGLTHGNEEKEASLPLLMATDIESKPMWSETKFHEWHIGHIHRKRTVRYDINKSRPLNEDLGVTVRYLSSLSGTEEWHHKKGFVGSTKAADAFIWNYDFGLIAHLNTNLIIE